MKSSNNITRTFWMIILLLISIYARTQSQPEGCSATAKNKVAILPITYIGDGSDLKLEQMRYSLQNIAYRTLQDDALELRFQDPAETNARLLRNGVNESTIRKFTPRDLAGILQVEYVVMGLVSQETKAISTFSNSTSSFNTRQHYHHELRHERNRWIHTRSRPDINTTVDLVVYNDIGQKIFNRSRRSLLTGISDYTAGLRYLLKRTPLYKR